MVAKIAVAVVAIVVSGLFYFSRDRTLEVCTFHSAGLTCQPYRVPARSYNLVELTGVPVLRGNAMRVAAWLFRTWPFSYLMRKNVYDDSL
jgi:hypothetical protein